MDTTRPLHDVFAGLAGTGAGAEPADVLRAGGHESLPDALVAEAVVSYADTAPIEVAEHLSTFVRAHSPVPGADDGTEAPGWLDALTTAPAAVDAAPAGATDLDGIGPGGSLDGGADEPVATWASDGPDDFGDAGFGSGGGPATSVDERPDGPPDPYADTPQDLLPEEPLGRGEAHSPDLGPVDLTADGVDLDTDPADLDDL
jgi:hypothetical protein